MAPSKINDSAVQARLAAEAARRRAEAEAAARRRAEEAARRAEQLKQQMRALKDEVSTGRGTALKTKALGLTQANTAQGTPLTQGTLVSAKDLIRSGGKLPLDRAGGATTLSTENVNDAKANCLDKAVDYTNALPPEQRKNAELLVLQDTRAGTEGTTGHVVVRQGDAIVDPTSGKSYASTAEYLKANPQYREAGTLAADDAKTIFETPPGSPERARALADAKVPEQLKTMALADATPGYDQAKADADAKTLHKAVKGLGTDEDAIFATLDGKSKEDIELIRQSYRRQFGSNMDEDLRGDFIGDEKINKALQGTDGTSKGRAEADLEKYQTPQGHLAALQLHKDDPEYTARYMQGLKDKGQLDQVMQWATMPDQALVSPPSPDDQQAMRKAGEFDGKQTFLNALKTAKDAGAITHGELNQLANDDEPWTNVMRELGLPQTARGSGADGAVKTVKGAAEDFKDANEEVKKTNEKLANELKDLGPHLTDEQKAEYIKKFQEDPKNKKVYEDREAKAKALADAIAKDPASLRNAALTNAEDAKLLKESLLGLADTSQAKTALEFFKNIDETTLSALGGKAFSDEVVQKGLPKAYAQFMAENENPKDAFAAFAEWGGQVLKPMFDGQGSTGMWQEGLEAIRLQAEGDWRNPNGNFDRLKQLATGFNEMSPVMKGLAGCALAVGVVQSVQAGRDGDLAAFTKEVTGTGRGAMEFLASGTQGLVEQGKLARFGVEATERATKLATFASRLAPGLGVVSSAVSLGMHTADMKDDPRLGTGIAIVGDTVAVLGGIVELVPGGQPVGLVLSSVGTGLSMLGDVINAVGERPELEADRKKRLEQMGVPEPLRTGMATNAAWVRKLEGLGLSPAEMQKVAQSSPWVVPGDDVLGIEQVAEFLKANGITGDKAKQFFERMDGPGNEACAALVKYLHGIAAAGLPPESTDAAKWKEQLEYFKKNNPEHAAALERLMA